MRSATLHVSPRRSRVVVPFAVSAETRATSFTESSKPGKSGVLPDASARFLKNLARVEDRATGKPWILAEVGWGDEGGGAALVEVHQ